MGTLGPRGRRNRFRTAGGPDLFDRKDSGRSAAIVARAALPVHAAAASLLAAGPRGGWAPFQKNGRSLPSGAPPRFASVSVRRREARPTRGRLPASGRAARRPAHRPLAARRGLSRPGLARHLLLLHRARHGAARRRLARSASPPRARLPRGLATRATIAVVRCHRIGSSIIDVSRILASPPGRRHRWAGAECRTGAVLSRRAPVPFRRSGCVESFTSAVAGVIGNRGARIERKSRWRRRGRSPRRAGVAERARSRRSFAVHGSWVKHAATP